MCTVTYVPTDSGFCLTSNRDEQVSRAAAVPPEVEQNVGYSLLFPKDGAKGGSWIVGKSTGDVAVLLNGALFKHEIAGSYTKSRGQVLIDIIQTEFPYHSFELTDLGGIEPFTLILFTAGKLYECKWDGNKKHTAILDVTKPYIWSSVTLYDARAMERRSAWFKDWYSLTSNGGAEEILDFHRFGGEQDSVNGLVINRGDKLRTLSITQVDCGKDQFRMSYHELDTDKRYVRDLAIEQKDLPTKEIPRLKWFRTKSFMVRLLNWEYWPMSIVYLPVMYYWFWLSLKSRTFFFFNTANPSIKNGGFTLESKAEIYDLIPQKYYPRTMCFTPNEDIKEIIGRLSDAGLDFPLIAKPDIGARGIQVKKLESTLELSDYIDQVKVDFLVQERVPYKNEVGIFYYRFPNEEVGHISGIVGKEFLTVRGNGKCTVQELLMAEPRYLLQLQVLRKAYGPLLDQVLADGKELLLVPYGNHSRGAKFIDLSHLITEQLRTTIDAVCREITGFHFGRLDIMYHSWEDLCIGKNFAIIEVNGAGSEPTHIYDPKHTIFFAWREIIRHWKLLYGISAMNKRLTGLQYMCHKQGMKMLRDNSAYFKLIA